SAVDSPAERLDILDLSTSASPTAAGQFTEMGSFERPNTLMLAPNLVAGLLRGATDALHVLRLNQSPALTAALSNLPPGSDYVFGVFNNEPLPRILFFVPGQSTLTVRPLVPDNGIFSFGPALSINLSAPLLGVYYFESSGDGSALLLFEDGVQGMKV